MNVLLMNKISKLGLQVFDDKYVYSDSVENPDAILVRSAKLHDMAFDKATVCIARAGAGYNNIPVDRCAKEGIVVFNTPGANANAVKELTLAGLLLASRDIADGIDYAKTLKGSEDVGKQVEANKSHYAGCELKGKTLVVIGLGAIGGPLANIAVELGMKVIGYDPYVSVNAAWNLSRRVQHSTDLKAALAQADYISIHIPLTKDTTGYLGAEEFAMIKDGCRLLNFSRGEIVDTASLLAALESGKIARYVTDFPSEEILGVDHVIAIPHLGASTEEAEDNCAEMAAQEIRAYLEKGSIVHSVNYPDCEMGELTADCRLVILHENIPNIVAQFSSALGNSGLNIESMNNRSKGALAVSVLDVTGQVNDDVADAIAAIAGVIRVRQIKK